MDGTLADTEMDGSPAFNVAFQELNLPFVWDEALYNRLLAIPGGLRRVKLHAEACGVALSQEQLNQVRDRKRLHYLERVRQGHVKLRPGVRRLLQELHRAGVQQWIVFSGSASVLALLEQVQTSPPLRWRRDIGRTRCWLSSAVVPMPSRIQQRVSRRQQRVCAVRYIPWDAEACVMREKKPLRCWTRTWSTSDCAFR